MVSDLPKRIAEGVTAKLNFDYSCNRGHSFGEYYVHGTVNEIVSANVDPKTHYVKNGFPAPQLSPQNGVAGRRPEVDFAVMLRAKDLCEVVIELKWAGSSHCKVENVLNDLCRLQVIKNTDLKLICVFILSGLRKDIDKLFKSELMKPGTNCLLIRPGETKIAASSERRAKKFKLTNNPHHQVIIDNLIANLKKIHSSRTSEYPEVIHTMFCDPRLSATVNGRFQTYAWVMGFQGVAAAT